MKDEDVPCVFGHFRKMGFQMSDQNEADPGVRLRSNLRTLFDIPAPATQGQIARILYALTLTQESFVRLAELTVALHVPGGGDRLEKANAFTEKAKETTDAIVDAVQGLQANDE